MRVAIMQPTYLPWSGYFDLMDQADCFVLLDDVQFSRQSWQQRNRILGPQGGHWLTVPVRRAGTPQRILEVEIETTTPWRRKHRDAILQGYAGAPGMEVLRDFIEQSYARDWRYLVDLNLHFIRALRDHLGITTPLRRASELEVEHPAGRSDRLVELCRALGADQYLSPAGAWEYLGTGEALREAGIGLLYHDYTPVPYRQRAEGFVSFLSVLDLLLNEGPSSLEVIRRGRGEPLAPEVFAAAREMTA
ncbi:MAG: hypothetical protein D6786_10750 [Gammaproteobacteria bacterium]|nr:MAG: hypothetical protein D6786_10750 [Gammaproteobacteria bacterium]